MVFIMSKFTTQGTYIYTHSNFEIYIYKLDSFTEDINKYKNIKLYRSCDQTQ